MKSQVPFVLTINGGSSSIRFAVYEAAEQPVLQLEGKIERIGLSGTSFQARDVAANAHVNRGIRGSGRRAAIKFLLDWLSQQERFQSIQAAGHRVVHGMKHTQPARITPRLLAELRRIVPYDPEHLPRELELIEELRRRHPHLIQVACFDTAFHRTMPQAARMLPIPRRYIAKGVERYGFHGLSYAYLMEELGRLDPVGAKGRVILAHLGNGASIAAVHRGKSIDTSMGFTPTAGLVMSTRTGDMDPGLFYYLARTEHMSAAQFQQMVNHQSGLLGVSGMSSDVRDLCAMEAKNVRAAEALDLFCYQAKKWIGAFAASLGGIDTLVFSAGIGENSPTIRSRICDGLEFLGIELDRQRNRKSAALISVDSARVKVRVIRTDEQLMIAKSVVRLLGLGGLKHKKKIPIRPS